MVIELSKEKEPCTSSSRNLARSDSCKKHKNFSRQAVAFWKETYDVSEETRGKANMIPVKRIYLLYLQTVLIIAGPIGRVFRSLFSQEVWKPSFRCRYKIENKASFHYALCLSLQIWRFRFSFFRPIQAGLSIITNRMVKMILGRWHHLLPSYKDTCKLLSLTSSTLARRP